MAIELVDTQLIRKRFAYNKLYTSDLRKNSKGGGCGATGVGDKGDKVIATNQPQRGSPVAWVGKPSRSAPSPPTTNHQQPTTNHQLITIFLSKV
ncbi:MAG: hypothetical protein ACHBN1_04530 [Heteroscytonema crispum UTEX LB 1556]